MRFTEEVTNGDVLTDAVGTVGAQPAEFGVHGTNGTACTFTDATFGRHVLYLGGIGTGKTVGMSALIRSVRESMTANDVMVVFDTKGDYHGEFARPGDVVVAGADAESYPEHRFWNLFQEFAGLPAGHAAEDEIFEMCNGLFANLLETGGDNVFFVQAARDVFTALVTAMFRESTELTNEDLRSRIGSMSVPEMQELLDRPDNADLRGARNYIAAEKSPTAQASVAYMQQVIQESFRSAFGRPGDFSIRQFVRAKGARALFLEYDVASGGMLAPVFKTMLDVAMKEAMSRQRTPGRVFFVLDEFALLPELTHLTNGLNFGRSLGLRFIVGTQNIKQVEAMYGNEMAASVLSAFGTVFAFRLYDGDSRDFVRGRFGKNKKVARFDSNVRSKGINESIIDGYVVEDWDLSSLPVGCCIAALPDHAPVRFQYAPPKQV
ncbi:type IV secretion system DNA-binding domain-containing protein [Curtobacterium sp. MCSS17_016]|uniref:type IV secretory system conjugative DNA transfer family protein n=1 Tax=Curtobacterium sp. MCSS17_016 TaxID=2175644 RepID=UPI000DA99B2C|nr:type IV secretion system DNA-binding domain-containing protein [Curtobacterium sp. MCSS17_016]WIE81023.1 type IV secretion system DNA-binding domain-containing protein [Curtobacterium sp. MCSS17_016]